MRCSRDRQPTIQSGPLVNVCSRALRYSVVHGQAARTPSRVTISGVQDRNFRMENDGCPACRKRRPLRVRVPWTALLWCQRALFVVIVCGLIGLWFDAVRVMLTASFGPPPAHHAAKFGGRGMTEAEKEYADAKRGR